MDRSRYSKYSLAMRFAIILLSILVLGACNTIQQATGVDAIYTNGRIWTGVEGQDGVRTVAIDSGRIVFVGPEIPVHLTSDRIVDLEDRFAMPGFQDNHVHFIEGGAALASVDLRDSRSPDEFTRTLATFARDLAPGGWVLNGNWDHTLWGGELPHRDWIDPQTARTPVFVIRIDGHMALANSAALEAAGITNETPDPEGGEIVRDLNGRSTGILRGSALDLVLAVIPPPSEDELMDQFIRAQEHALSVGLTKVHAVTAYPTETNMLDIFKLAKSRGLMKIRAQVSTPIESWQAMLAEVKNNGRGDDLLSWGGVKGFVDGSLGARTAWFYKPYIDAPQNNGLPLNDLSQLAQWMQDAAGAGLQLSIHAIGDRAIDWTQAELAKISGDEVPHRRFRIEHFQHPTPDAIRLLAASGNVAAMQPFHAVDDGRWASERIGPDRLRTTYAFRTVLDEGVILTFGSDWPVAPLAPLQGVYAAVTRRTLDGANPDGWFPEQKISVEEALTAYTVANAYAFGDENDAGTLEPGKRADIVVLSADPRVVSPDELGTIKVLMTVIAGEVVFDVGQR